MDNCAEPRFFARSTVPAWAITASVVGSWTLPAQAQLIREPYLQSVTATSVVVAWRAEADTALDSVVHYGTTTSTLTESRGATGVERAGTGFVDHTVLIDGLSPGVAYYYDVGTGSGGVQSGGTSEHFFRTAPPTGSSDPFSFWVLGDSGHGTLAQAAVLEGMLSYRQGISPDLFLHVGDIAYNTGTDSEFTNNHFAVYQDVLAHSPFWPAIGNHEASGGASDSATQSGPYYEAFILPTQAEAGGVASSTEAYYSFDHGNAHFIVLDSDDSATVPASPQLQWLESDLKNIAGTQDWVIALMHHPPYSKGSHDSDSASDSGGRMVRVRENILPILEGYGVDLVLAGHSHTYERSYLIDGVYGYGSNPSFQTPQYATLLANGHILDDGDGQTAGDGAYLKERGRFGNQGTVYVVAGHGGGQVRGSGLHPVMVYSELDSGSCVVSIDGPTLTLQNINADGEATDEFTIYKEDTSCTEDADCTDTDACTVGTCSAGACVYSALSCGDSNACTSDSCDTALGCINQAVSCDDGNLCTTDSCDSKTGCVHDAVSCDDKDACTTDSCAPASGCLNAVLSCDDNSACTTDSCDSQTGCINQTVSCDDGSLCTEDSCDEVVGCVNQAIACSDHDACTTDACDPGTGCYTTGVSCDDDDACTQDSCDSKTGCINLPIACNDGNACTLDSCDPVLGCQTTPLTCDDNDVCTVDSCDGALGCLNLALNCDDGNACTLNTCDSKLGCQTEPVVCNDGDACTLDSCEPASGCQTEPVVCNDGNACTADSCDPASGCLNAPLSCDDDNACTADSCNAATGCVHIAENCDDADSCTIDSCQAESGCLHQPIGGCSDVETSGGSDSGGAPSMAGAAGQAGVASDGGDDSGAATSTGHGGAQPKGRDDSDSTADTSSHGDTTGGPAPSDSTASGGAVNDSGAGASSGAGANSGAGGVPDEGLSAGGADAGKESVHGTGGGCGCRVAPAPLSERFMLGLTALLLLGVQRRRSRRG